MKNYDYTTPGEYFVTICTKKREELFGKIQNSDMNLSEIGRIVYNEIQNIEKHYKNIKINKYVIMPNHLHMIISILDTPGTEGINPFPTIKYDIPNVVGKFKAAVTRNVGNAFMHSVKNNLWQISYHDHIIRNEKEYAHIWEYIDKNIIHWELDCFYSNNAEM